MTEDPQKRRELTRLLKKGSDILSNLRAVKVVDFGRYKRNHDAMKRIQNKLNSKGKENA